MRGEKFSKHLSTLNLAIDYLEKNQLLVHYLDSPPQVSLIGPNQAGKSTVINWLLKKPLARVSPLAGFTMHPQGFVVDARIDSIAWLDEYFRDYHRCLPEALTGDGYDCYSLTEVPADHRSPLSEVVLWDTPDFDSVDAEAYRHNLLHTAALADVIVLVVSKDKYADQSVWDMLKLLEPLDQPTLVCLNKVEEASASILTRSLTEKWQAARDDKAPPIIVFPYVQDVEADASVRLRRECEQLITALRSGMAAIRRDRYVENAKRYIRVYWDAWLAPIQAEHGMLNEWRDLIDGAIADSLALYRRDYLNHPQHYQTFQRALAELLRLLEIPGLAGALLAARKVVTWPLRQVARLGRAVVRRHREDGGAENETAILRQTIEHLFIQLGEALLLKREDEPAKEAWWKALSGVMREERKTLLAGFDAAVAQYALDFQPEIEKTARRLYARLEEHPATLNGLRATRLTTDAAALAVALHSGGIGMHDFIVAPAMLSLTSMLAEGALGYYMNNAEAELKQRQFEEVARLFRDGVGSSLVRLTEKLDARGRFDIPKETLDAARPLLD